MHSSILPVTESDTKANRWAKFYFDLNTKLKNMSILSGSKDITDLVASLIQKYNLK